MSLATHLESGSGLCRPAPKFLTQINAGPGRKNTQKNQPTGALGFFRGFVFFLSRFFVIFEYISLDVDKARRFQRRGPSGGIQQRRRLHREQEERLVINGIYGVSEGGGGNTAPTCSGKRFFF